jgi:hypothetical protein
MTGSARCCSLNAILFGINKMRPSVLSLYQCTVLSLVLCYRRACDWLVVSFRCCSCCSGFVTGIGSVAVAVCALC